MRAEALKILGMESLTQTPAKSKGKVKKDIYRKSLAPNMGSGVSNTQPPRDARSGSSDAFVKVTCGSRFFSTSASITREHHGHALPVHQLC